MTGLKKKKRQVLIGVVIVPSTHARKGGGAVSYTHLTLPTRRTV